MVSFINESTIHGVAYIFGPSRNIFVRIFWIFLFIFSIFSVIYLIQVAHENWQKEPFVVIRKERTRKLEELPKFAVTVCPGIISDDKSFTYDALKKRIEKEDKGNNTIFSEKECFNLIANSLWCGDFRDLTENWAKKSKNPQVKDCSYRASPRNYTSVLSTLLKSYEGNFQKILYGDMSLIKALKGNDEDYMKHAVKAKKMLTRWGVCSTFNWYSKSMFRDINEAHGLTNSEDPVIEWSPDSEYFSSYAKHPQRMKIEELPGTERKIAGVILLKDLLIKNACYYYKNEFRVIIHQPNTIPSKQDAAVNIKYQESPNFALKIRIKNDRALESYRVVKKDIRKCLFEDEEDMYVFRSYSKYHCDIECVDLDVFGTYCAPLELPRFKNSSRKYCVSDFIRISYDCICPPNCNKMTYEIVSSLKLEDDKIFGDKDINIKGHKISNTVVIEYESDEAEQTNSFTISTFPNFLAEVGGYLGLFLGCSLLSLIEIAYFVVEKLLNLIMRIFSKRHQPTKIEKLLESVEWGTETLN